MNKIIKSTALFVVCLVVIFSLLGLNQSFSKIVLENKSNSIINDLIVGYPNEKDKVKHEIYRDESIRIIKKVKNVDESISVSFECGSEKYQYDNLIYLYRGNLFGKQHAYYIDAECNLKKGKASFSKSESK